MSAGVHAGLLEGAGTGPAGAGVGQVDATRVGVLGRLAVAEDLHRLPRESRAATSGRDHDNGAPAVGHYAAVQPVQRIADQR